MNVGPSRPKLAERDLVVVLGAVAAGAVGVDVDLERVGRGEVADAHLRRPSRCMISTPSTSSVTAADVTARGAQVEPAVRQRERVVAVAGVDADAVDLAGVERELRAVERDLERARRARASAIASSSARAGDDQRAAIEPHRQRALDELALAVLDPRALDVAADLLGERPREVGVVERGDEQQVLVLRDRAAEQPLARLGVGEQPVAQRVGAHARHVEQHAVDVARAARGAGRTSARTAA